MIASVGRSNETLIPLTETLIEDGVEVLVVDNRGELDASILDDRVRYHRCEGFNVFQAWNVGIRAARLEGDDWVAVLNDDIVLEYSACSRVAETLKARTDVWIAGFDYERHKRLGLREAVGSFREHGIGGFAFMLRPESRLEFDPLFNWWGGDDDLVYTCRFMGGKAMVVEGVHVQHPPGGGTSSQHYPEVMAELGSDRLLLQAKWGKSW
ncbi:MAG TPA: glycosyltransferase [Sporichthya sp.]|nr:glycosyltransferase [Sporichthya sp.]